MAVYIRSKALLTFTLDVLFDIFISIARAVARLIFWGVGGRLDPSRFLLAKGDWNERGGGAKGVFALPA